MYTGSNYTRAHCFTQTTKQCPLGVGGGEGHNVLEFTPARFVERFVFGEVVS